MTIGPLESLERLDRSFVPRLSAGRSAPATDLIAAVLPMLKANVYDPPDLSAPARTALVALLSHIDGLQISSSTDIPPLAHQALRQTHAAALRWVRNIPSGLGARADLGLTV